MGTFDTLKSLAGDLIVPASAQEWLTTTRTFAKGPAHLPAVTASVELTRIANLPRRPAVDLDGSDRALALVELMTARLAKPAGACACKRLGRPCIATLKPAQAWALYEGGMVGGILGPIGVGHGKTILDLLTPLVVKGCKVAVLLIPPNLKNQLIAEYLQLKEHFRVPSLIVGDDFGEVIAGVPILYVVPYSKICRADNSTILDKIVPDTIIADEAHKLRNRQTATTARVLRYFSENRGTRLFAWSGTLTAKSIKDYAHLAALALRDGSPLPQDPNVVEEWSLAIDPKPWPAPMGALKILCNGPAETLHQAYHRRLVETKGIVATKAGAVDASINFTERKLPEVPPEIVRMLAELRAGWVRPDGEELVDLMQVCKSARELACGFFYRWKFPKNEPEDLILEWFARRKAWHKELREKLKQRRADLDSPLLCAKAAIRAYMQPAYEGNQPIWAAATWLPWLEIRDRVYHESEAVWIDDFLARDAAQWAVKNKGVVWYEHDAFGKRVATLANLPLHGGGKDAESRILAENGGRSVVASIAAHGMGRDGLQRLFDRQLVANPPASGLAWEQLLGRLHRIGQASDEVSTLVYRHTPEMSEAVDKALIQAKYIQDTMGTLQKLLAADYAWELKP